MARATCKCHQHAGHDRMETSLQQKHNQGQCFLSSLRASRRVCMRCALELLVARRHGSRCASLSQRSGHEAPASGVGASAAAFCSACAMSSQRVVCSGPLTRTLAHLPTHIHTPLSWHTILASSPECCSYMVPCTMS